MVARFVLEIPFPEACQPVSQPWGPADPEDARAELDLLLEKVNKDFPSRMYALSWFMTFLDSDVMTLQYAELALRVLNALDHRNKHGERPYVDPVYLDLVRRFVQKVEKSPATCPDLQKLKQRCGLMGRDPVPTSY